MIDSKSSDDIGIDFTGDTNKNITLSDNTLNTQFTSIRFKKKTTNTTITGNKITVRKKEKTAIEFSSTKETIDKEEIKKKNTIIRLMVERR